MKKKKKFLWREFIACNKLDELLQYADDTLLSLGQGSSRAVYVLSSRFALKIACDDEGIEQNTFELDKDTLNLPALVKVVWADEECRWLVVELVKEADEHWFNDCVVKIDRNNLSANEFRQALCALLDDKENHDEFIETLRILRYEGVMTDIDETVYFSQWGTDV